MKKVEEMITSLLHSLLHLSDHSAGSLNQSQLHEGISNLMSEEILLLYRLACELAMPGLRSIDWEKVIQGFQSSRLVVQVVGSWPMIAVPELECWVSWFVKNLSITITSLVCINQH